MPDPLATPGSERIIRGALEGLGPTLSKLAGKIAKPLLDRAIVDLGIGLHSYLEASYNKCRYFKTILNPGQPLEVLDYYVNISLSSKKRTIADVDLVQELPKLRHVVVTGLAGSGKSMFMKYLTVCRFENPQGLVPLFVELRTLNNISQKDLIEFIRASCTAKGYPISSEQFKLALSAGTFILILDGFDELNHEFRDKVSSQILEICDLYPATNIIVSSRKDERFGSWRSFFVFEVDELTKAQTMHLIESLDYDLGVKKRFLKEVKEKLYESHTSFLSSPLLTTIMLLTFEEFAEIPVKMHSFYSQAFDTLFQKHDASKEQYQRKTHTALGREDFKATFAAFCAMSYLDQKFSFPQEDLEETAESAVKYVKQATTGIPRSLTAKTLIDDLKESVCLLQQDGLETAFVHRSFQEYFAALFATSLHGEKVKRVLDKYALRFGDSVVGMAMDIAREPVEQEWVLPVVNELAEILQLSEDGVSTGERYANLFSAVIWHRMQKKVFTSVKEIREDIVGPLVTIWTLYPQHFGKGSVIQYIDVPSLAVLQKLVHPDNSGRPGYESLESAYDYLNGSKDNSYIEFHMNGESDWWLDGIGAQELFKKIEKAFAAIRRDIAARAKRRQNILSEFL